MKRWVDKEYVRWKVSAMKKNLKFLSRSVLLEESGLPKINRVIIVSVFLMVVLFTLWANQMLINDTVSVSGKIVRDISEKGFHVNLSVPSKEITMISEDMEALISISGITDRKKIDARVERIIKVPQYDDYSRTFYEVRVVPMVDDETQKTLKHIVIRGMEARVEIVTGKRNLLQYYFSKIWDARNSNEL